MYIAMPFTKLTKISTVLLILVTRHFSITTAAPVAEPEPNPQTSNQINNAYSGMGGQAKGGSVSSTPNPDGLLNGINLIDIFSGNGGNGGEAKSGSASPGLGRVATTSSDGTTTVGGSGDSTSTNSGGSNSIGNSFTGSGGIADGGSSSSGALIRLFSGNGGNGGKANSGSSGPGSNSASTSRTGRKRRIARFITISLD